MALLFAGGLWVLTVNQARGMGVGPGTMGMALPLFTGTWVAMMGAMMLPSIAPAAILSTGTTTQRRAGRHASLAVAHMIGFFVPWAVYGMAAFVALVGVEHLVDASPVRARWLGVAILAAAGLYQFSPWKHRCMAH
jgi:predicted metal-binding membrane protein